MGSVLAAGGDGSGPPLADPVTTHEKQRTGVEKGVGLRGWGRGRGAELGETGPLLERDVDQRPRRVLDHGPSGPAAKPTGGGVCGPEPRTPPPSVGGPWLFACTLCQYHGWRERKKVPA